MKPVEQALGAGSASRMSLVVYATVGLAMIVFKVLV